MAITDHNCFRQPDSKNLRLWRYMDFTKFVSMLASKQLFFCRSDLFEDPFEGSYSKANVELRPHVYKDMPKDQLTHMSNFSKWAREWTYINCWHANEHESAAMWKLYAQTNEAVAIETDYETLATVLPNNVFIGLVNYIDYETEWLPEGNTFYPFTHKRKSFEHEREVRTVIQDLPIINDAIAVGSKNSLSGSSVDVDIHALIKCVHVSPTAPAWFQKLTEQATAQFGFSFNVKKSNLYAEPVF